MTPKGQRLCHLNKLEPRSSEINWRSNLQRQHKSIQLYHELY